MREMVGLTKYARIGCLGMVFCFVIGCTDWGMGEAIQSVRVSRRINGFLRQAVRYGASRNYDLRPNIPIEWKRVCIDSAPYANQTIAEKKYGGKFHGKYQQLDDSSLMVVGIDANNEMTQVVLDGDVSRFLGQTYRGCGRNCLNSVSREQAVLTPVTRDGKTRLQLGSQ